MADKFFLAFQAGQVALRSAKVLSDTRTLPWYPTVILYFSPLPHVL